MDNYKLYDAFEHLCADAFPDNATRGTVAVITAYFDATYNNPKGILPNLPCTHLRLMWGRERTGANSAKNGGQN